MATKIDTDGTMTVIGESVRIRGNLNGDEDLHVLGRVEGAIELKRTLVVAESGIVKAEVSVKNAVISGVVVGNINASESVELTAEGRMVGDIVAPRVIIVDGASFRGNVDMGDIEDMPARPPRREERPASSPAPAMRASSPAPAKRADPRPMLSSSDDGDSSNEDTTAVPTKKTVVANEDRKKNSSAKKPSFLDPPKAKGLPSKKSHKQKRVVVKRK